MKAPKRTVSEICEGVCRAIVLLSVLAIAGCSQLPTKVAWQDSQAVVEPGESKVEAAQSGGYLWVDTEEFVETPDPAQSSIHHRSYGLYNDKGDLVRDVDNTLVSPIVLPPGRYIVVTEVSFKLRRVQVVIREGQITKVSLDHLERGPALGAS